MSQPEHAQILPISDLDLARDVHSKLRLAGIVGAVHPHNSCLVALTDPNPAPGYAPVSLLIDLSLCTDQPSGWKKSKQLVPPQIKSMLMVIGHLVQRQTPVDVSFVTDTAKKDLGKPQIREAIPAFTQDQDLVPNRYFVLEAILVKPLDHTFDLRLWNRAARLRSQHEWFMHSQPAKAEQRSPIQSDKKGKRKAKD
ncbi:uncharacterized protein MEPE_00958 [Melanopsichium pennsylvanicum]|uniref:Uncharacterized protein n=2 Tax=Melanopsichium pennsylvanicum TaxID=63383 RepID=A0AAJ4XH76_9BASI|nr:conserved hypothetical protein [Melanopsichium pennsylvanicum 4]SNX82252.1 uncharacterized protein MEPE_00958 [Melanopsichium pennsylvanicum]